MNIHDMDLNHAFSHTSPASADLDLVMVFDAVFAEEAFN
jgi:hypothetical protein